MSDAFELNYCVLGGDDPSRVFVAKISPKESISSLRKVIKDDQKDAFQHVDAHSLILSKVSVYIDKSLEENLSKLDLDAGLLQTMQKLSKVFSEQPVQTYLHIVVQCRPADMLRSDCSLLSPQQILKSIQNATGRTSASDELSSWGRLQAASLGKEWKNVQIDHLYSSTLERAVDTARAISSNNLNDALKMEQSEQLIEHYWGTSVLRYVEEGKDNDFLFKEVWGFERGSGDTPNRDYRPSGGGESASDVARRGREFVEKQILGRFAVPLARSLDSYADMKWKYGLTMEMLPEGIPHIVVVSHNVFLNELYEGIWCWNKDRVDSRAYWSNAGWSRHILCYDAETENLDFINIVSPEEF